MTTLIDHDTFDDCAAVLDIETAAALLGVPSRMLEGIYTTERVEAEQRFDYRLGASINDVRLHQLEQGW